MDSATGTHHLGSYWMHFTIFRARLACVLALAGVLAACGGGDGASQSAGEAKSAGPAEASASSTQPDVRYAP
jgi:ABC-type glycerol-3-phosphate transport system substrate-binding protein